MYKYYSLCMYMYVCAFIHVCNCVRINSLLHLSVPPSVPHLPMIPNFSAFFFILKRMTPIPLRIGSDRDLHNAVVCICLKVNA